MEKKVKLVMTEDKTIIVFLNDIVKINIYAYNRKINADDLYSLFDYNKGDIYTLEKDNPENIDVKVFEFFSNMIYEIIENLNKLSSE